MKVDYTKDKIIIEAENGLEALWLKGMWDMHKDNKVSDVFDWKIKQKKS